jgi:hypothetical protein
MSLADLRDDWWTGARDRRNWSRKEWRDSMENNSSAFPCAFLSQSRAPLPSSVLVHHTPAVLLTQGAFLDAFEYALDFLEHAVTCQPRTLSGAHPPSTSSDLLHSLSGWVLKFGFRTVTGPIHSPRRSSESTGLAQVTLGGMKIWGRPGDLHARG